VLFSSHSCIRIVVWNLTGDLVILVEKFSEKFFYEIPIPSF
jgi:hypothetical protein